MRLPRASGILLHPTSLPSPFGIGDLGPSAFAFVDLLAETGQRWWQILPLGPTAFGNSPYQSYSSFAGNPLLISPELLQEEGLLSASDSSEIPRFPEHRVDFDAALSAKDRIFRRAFESFQPLPPEFRRFVKENTDWLGRYALFMALKDAHSGTAWFEWEPKLAAGVPEAIDRASERLAGSVRYHQFLQYMFDRQWRRLRAVCAERSIGLIGDLPIFVAQDSADVWARPDLFRLDANRRPTVVAGVPPDYFSATGQLWGNPLYRWDEHIAEDFAWWIARIRAQSNRVDLVRLDHFRGFSAYWEVPAGADTAEHGRWAPAPGVAFLEAVRERLGGLPLVAEDLGDITPDVLALRDRFGLPGMRVIQFGLGGEPGTDFHLPYRFVNHCIAYTGTHDNDTTYGWFAAPPTGTELERSQHKAQREFAARFLGSSGDEVHWDVIRAALASVADTVIIPLQDVLGLGSAARMNVPGRPEGNWGWRFRPGQVRPKARARLAALTAVYGRWNGAMPPAPAAAPRPIAVPEPVPPAPTAPPSAQRPKARPRKRTDDRAR
jgi:4-alpha-glucanotransferase